MLSISGTNLTVSLALSLSCYLLFYIDKPSEYVNFKNVLMKSVTVHLFNIMFIVFVVWKSTDINQLNIRRIFT